MKLVSSLSLSFLSGWKKGRIGCEETIGGRDGVVTLDDVVDLAFVSDGEAEAAGDELGREADAAIEIEVLVTFGFKGVTEVEVDVEETAAGTATFAVVVVEVATEAVVRVVVEAESVVLEYIRYIRMAGVIFPIQY